VIEIGVNFRIVRTAENSPGYSQIVLPHYAFSSSSNVQCGITHDVIAAASVVGPAQDAVSPVAVAYFRETSRNYLPEIYEAACPVFGLVYDDFRKASEY